MASHGDEDTASNGGFREGDLGNKLVKDGSTRIKLLIFQNALNKKTSLNRARLWLLCWVKMVCDEGIEEWVTNGSRFQPTSTISNPASMIVINLSMLIISDLTPK